MIELLPEAIEAGLLAIAGLGAGDQGVAALTGPVEDAIGRGEPLAHGGLDRDLALARRQGDAEDAAGGREPGGELGEAGDAIELGDDEVDRDLGGEREGEQVVLLTDRVEGGEGGVAVAEQEVGADGQQHAADRSARAGATDATQQLGEGQRRLGSQVVVGGDLDEGRVGGEEEARLAGLVSLDLAKTWRCAEQRRLAVRLGPEDQPPGRSAALAVAQARRLLDGLQRTHEAPEATTEDLPALAGEQLGSLCRVGFGGSAATTRAAGAEALHRVDDEANGDDGGADGDGDRGVDLRQAQLIDGADDEAD